QGRPPRDPSACRSSAAFSPRTRPASPLRPPRPRLRPKLQPPCRDQALRRPLLSAAVREVLRTTMSSSPTVIPGLHHRRPQSTALFALEPPWHSLEHAPQGDRAGVYQHRRQRGGPLAAAARGAACHRSPSCPRGEPVWELVFSTALNVLTSMLWGLSEDVDVSMKFRAVVRSRRGMGRRMKRLWDRYDVLWKKFVEESGRRGEEDEGKGGKAFLQVMVEVLERRDQKDPLTMDHVKALFLELILGGTDTTSTTIEWAMAELMRNPDIMRKIQDELDAVVGKERAVEESDVPKLEYLRAVTKETLRLHPVVPLLVPRSPSSPCTVGGYTIPKGSKVFVNVWMIQRDAAIWGEDAVEFRPERFLTAADDKYEFRGTNFAYLPFGSGRRMCAGISLAEKMVTHMLASFLHSFRWKLPEGEKLELGERFGLVMRKAEPLVLVPTARFDDPDLYS
ncbi:unnamed protein product, partial [Musa acuminata subsp. burmannicoides]